MIQHKPVRIKTLNLLTDLDTAIGDLNPDNPTRHILEACRPGLAAAYLCSKADSAGCKAMLANFKAAVKGLKR